MAVEKKQRQLDQVWDELIGEGRDHGQPAVPQGGITINGGIAGGTIYFGNVQTRNVYNVKPRITVVQTGVGVLDAAQKKRLLDLRDQISEVSQRIEGGDLSKAYVMKRLNDHMNVNSYAEILAEDFGKAEAFMLSWRGKVDTHPDALRSLTWRNSRIQAIHARCKEVEGWDLWRLKYMRKAFKKTSLLELVDDDLEKVYRAVMRKKAE